LSGGELGAALIIDAVTRLIPGALGNEDSAVNESFSGTEAIQADWIGTRTAGNSTSHQPLVTSHCVLDFPHYTRPAEFLGWSVPEILLGGNHEEIRRWRLQKAIDKTRRNRPDLLSDALPTVANVDPKLKP